MDLLKWVLGTAKQLKEEREAQPDLPPTKERIKALKKRRDQRRARRITRVNRKH